MLIVRKRESGGSGRGTRGGKVGERGRGERGREEGEGEGREGMGTAFMY